MQVDFLGAKLGLSERAISKAREYQRLATARGISVDTLPVCAVELACQMLQEPFQREQCLRAAGVRNSKQYLAALSSVQNALQLKKALTVRDLCSQFACLQHVESAEKLLRVFKQRFMESLTAARQLHVDFARPTVPAAAFYLAVRSKKGNVDSKKLRDLINASPAEFNGMCAQVLEHCKDMVSLPKKKKQAIKKAKHGSEDAAELEDEEELLDGEHVELDDLKHNPTAMASKRGEYEEWKARVLAKDEAERGVDSKSNGKSKGKKRKHKHADGEAEDGDDVAAELGLNSNGNGSGSNGSSSMVQSTLSFKPVAKPKAKAKGSTKAKSPQKKAKVEKAEQAQTAAKGSRAAKLMRLDDDETEAAKLLQATRASQSSSSAAGSA